MRGAVAFAVALLGVVTAGDAGAVTYKYTYVGNTLDLVYKMPHFDYPVRPYIAPGYAFDLVIDESELPGGTLRNATVEFSYCTFSCNPDHVFVGTQGFGGVTNFGDPKLYFDEAIESQGGILLKTNAEREIVDYTLWAIGNNGPTNLIASGGDKICSSEVCTSSISVYANQSPGTWTVAPVPLPSTLALFAPGLLVLVAATRRARRRAAA